MEGALLVDLLLLAVFAYALYDGVRRGFIALALSVVVWGLAFVVAIALSRLLFAAYADVGLEVGGVIRVLIFSFVLFLAAAWLVVGYQRLAAPLRALIATRPTLAFAERWLGVFPALARTAITAAVLLTGIHVFPFWPPARDAVTESRLAGLFVGIAGAVEQPLASALGAGAQPLFLAVIQGREEQRLHFPDNAKAEVDLAAEDALYALLNEERVRNGFAPLQRDLRLTVIARDHAREMFELRYLSHYSPRTGDPRDRLAARGIAFGAVVGENVAYAPNASFAHQGFLRSVGHRRNLLDPRFDSAGVGAVTVASLGTLYVQVFVGR